MSYTTIAPISGHLKITPLNAPLGGVVTGIDVSQPPAPSIILQIKKALCEYHILIFKQQKLTDEQLLNFATYFGALFVPPDNVPVLESASGIISNVVIVSNQEGGSLGDGEVPFHTDHIWTPYPSSASFLYAEEIPSEGGDTYWLNLNLAYETLEEEVKQEIANLQVITYNPLLREPGKPFSSYRSNSHIPVTHPVFPHPLVRTHPESGKKILYLNHKTEVEIVGMEADKGANLIATLREHLYQERFYYRHKWSVGDIVYWDNQSTLHRREAFDSYSRRVLKRVSLAGGKPF
ncbi:MAG TPA: taurine dioxygenase [Cyanobacteria bacterium UBA11149]|nr:taurine dioxygenase [Cyanobacteria bacterium UBA11367]HBE59908.1 taurine dioxygenase [Cyanobacteria bacterium UBA11366]HBK64709.1 taurine dioxygenase [Cyanobacteria bacterium UBA11166]HBR75864.1 taurine dioxygenase [Cyanobacteria bacterium UBA11159]HBS69286.1 taurine dioxygenase [Cyanobacteria bacterium UBA11153]HBW90437.1 taurine dioxygenase [Cyanobacteria bacterium UBA11149]HCA96641.1 taurine dioxygenase [Cyanobacteria bacterium UBA9226]